MHHHKEQNHKRKQALWRLRQCLQGTNLKHAHHSKYIHEPALVATRSEIEPVLLRLAPASIPTSSMIAITRRESENLYQKFGGVKVDLSWSEQGKKGKEAKEDVEEGGAQE